MTYSWFAWRPASRTTFVICALLLGVPAAGRAQDTSRTAAMDSLLARLRALEASVDVLQKQLAEQAGSAVQTHSRMQSEITGRVVMNAFSNERRVNNVDDPQFVLRDGPSTLPSKGFGMSIRQAMLGLRTTVSDVGGATLRGVVDVDFYGGQQPSSGGRTFPLLRLRTAHATLEWPHAELLAGQEIPLFSPLNPVSPAAFGTPDFVAAGNLWLWLPQVRLSLDRGNAVRFGIQGAVLAPTSGDAAGAFDTDFDNAERTRRPYLESRVRVRWGEFEMEREIGCAAHVGWVAVPAATVARPDSMLVSHAAGCDVRLPLVAWLELRGEAYSGQLVRGLGGDAVGQGVSASGRPVHNAAGWAQLNVKPLGATWSSGIGCGIDDPRDSDIPGIASRTQNTACAVYAVMRPIGPTFIGAEVRRIETRYLDTAFRNHHINVAMGFEF